MNEDITALITFDKTESLLLIKPLHFTFCQNRTLLSQLFSASGCQHAENKKTTPELDSIYQSAMASPPRIAKYEHPTFPYYAAPQNSSRLFNWYATGRQAMTNTTFLPNQAFLKNIFVMGRET
jgi:hypothetical protein